MAEVIANRLDDRIARRISRLMKKQGLSVEKLSKLTGLSKPYLYSTLRGERRINTDMMMSFCKALGVEAWQLVSDDLLEED